VARQTKAGVGELMNSAMFSMTEAKFTMGDFSQLVLNSTEKARLKADTKHDNVAGPDRVADCDYNTHTHTHI